MKISLDWLRDFVPWEGDAEELAAKLTAAGLNVEGIEEFALAFPGVVTARVLATQPHPDAGKLTLCSVHDGRENLAVVCGASNVRPGLNVLLARPGAILPGGVHIKAARIRGVASEGMICSASELRLGDEQSGIMELPADTEPGTAADEIFGWRDQVLDLEVTPNRPDWLSHFGVAREVAAFSGALLKVPAVWTPPKSGGERLEMTVEIEDFQDCPRYLAHLARGVKVGPSPALIRRRLLAVGTRPRNNVVDITNYVMLELGQPLHAFDRAKLSGARITVRRAAEQTPCVTLDGQTRRLGAAHLVIADAVGPAAIAGVMGAARSEIDAHTQEVLLESAFFNPRVVRQSARSLGLVSESSYRFEREADWNMVERAAQRALHLLQQHAGARIVPERADRQNPDRPIQPAIPLRMAHVNRLLGTALETAEAVRLLQALGLKVVPLGPATDRKSGAANLMVEVPSFRRDLKLEVDLVEEIARLHGYDRLDTEAPARGAGGRRRPVDVQRESCRHYLSAVGYAEIVTSSFMSAGDMDRLRLSAADRRRRGLTVCNPRHGGETMLRTTLLPSLLGAVRHNLNADAPTPLRLFQINRAFLADAPAPPDLKHADERLLPAEPLFLQLAVAGRRDRVHGDAAADVFEIKGVLEQLGRRLGIPWELLPDDVEPFCQPGRQWRLRGPGGEALGTAGTLAAEVLAAFAIDQPVAVAEIELSMLPSQAGPSLFTTFSRFPAVKRDLSLLVPEGTPFAAVAATAREAGGELLAEVELFDIYRGKGLAPGIFALGIRLKFRSNKGNLKGKTIDRAIAQITAALADRLGVGLRG